MNDAPESMLAARAPRAMGTQKRYPPKKIEAIAMPVAGHKGAAKVFTASRCKLKLAAEKYASPHATACTAKITFDAIGVFIKRQRVRFPSGICDCSIARFEHKSRTFLFDFLSQPSARDVGILKIDAAGKLRLGSTPVTHTSLLRCCATPPRRQAPPALRRGPYPRLTCFARSVSVKRFCVNARSAASLRDTRPFILSSQRGALSLFRRLP